MTMLNDDACPACGMGHFLKRKELRRNKGNKVVVFERWQCDICQAVLSVPEEDTKVEKQPKRQSRSGFDKQVPDMGGRKSKLDEMKDEIEEGW